MLRRAGRWHTSAEATNKTGSNGLMLAQLWCRVPLVVVVLLLLLLLLLPTPMPVALGRRGECATTAYRWREMHTTTSYVDHWYCM